MIGMDGKRERERERESRRLDDDDWLVVCLGFIAYQPL